MSTTSKIYRSILAGIGLIAALLLMGLGASQAQADFGFSEDFDGTILDTTGSDPFTQAGGHPDAVTNTFKLNTFTPSGYTGNWPDGQMKDVVVDLPLGFVGDPSATPAKCTAIQLAANLGNACPAASQVGTLLVKLAAGTQGSVKLYNMVAQPGQAAVFGANFTVPIVLNATVNADDYGLTVSSISTSQSASIVGVAATFWGVPGDHVSGIERKPLLRMPTSCTGPMEFALNVNSWEHPENVLHQSYLTHNLANNPIGNTGCENVPFSPTVNSQPTTSKAESPTGLLVDISLPTDGIKNPDGVSQSDLKDVVMRFPEGMTVNPSAADGLKGCSEAEIGLGGDTEVQCPDGARIGTVEMTTPVLDETLKGSVYQAEQGNNPFNSTLAIYIVAENEERGITIKLAGEVTPDENTGRLVATFKDNPQLPLKNMHLTFKSGSRAPLVTPSACGSYDIVTELTPWARPDEVVTQTSSFTIDKAADGGPCGPAGFAPSFAAGAASPVAGGFSPFSLAVGRSDGDQELRSLRSVRLPEGLLGKVSSVPLCDGVAADAGSCPEGSRVGRVLVAAGAGALPLWVPQAGKSPTSVSLTGPYRGAPYGLSIVVPAQAGPFDLGRVVVRSALHVDPRTARLSTGIDEARVYGPDGQLEQVLEGQMPTILEGIPLKVRELRVVVDRDGFTVNPTDCSEQRVTAEAVSVSGATAGLANRFQVGDCARLGFRPKLAMRLIGKGRTRTGTHPGLKTILTQPAGQANIARAQVALPKSVVLDPRNSTDPALVCDYDKAQAADCPASSVIGKATARTPLLRGPLSGNVHLVQGIRFGPTGNRIRTTPSLLVKLRGEVSINLYARTTVRNNRLVTVFDQVPDAQVSRFDLQINGGKKGILVITRTAKSNINICNSRQIGGVRTRGQNGRQANYNTRIKTPCAKKTDKKAKRKASKKK